MNESNMKTLFRTNIGSHLWGMELPYSDIDIFEVYIAPKEDILIGKADLKSKHIQEGGFDIARHEIGKVECGAPIIRVEKKN